ncbi:precorrin-3B C(17)-methyltransferase [Halodesulfovibrio aestuarii]|uniref:Precorrin-3B C(17)-methyltransferase n=1 Tax=Halodesulfovibrio aestuarii TaxID=126333 RepID=A0ABV4JPA8_9BACT
MSSSLKIVGLGPGDSALLTPQAQKAIADADVIVGYTLYVDLVPEALKEGKEIISTGMMGEITRCEKAIEVALSGKDTAVVCSGDPGIYAMSGLVYELAEKHLDTLEIEVIAGIPALSASSALLGAPLMHDFAVISLSDLLTEWDVIEKRLKAAAEADFVIVLYNPKSKRRDWQLGKALEIVGTVRSADTPVGLVKSAYRKEQKTLVFSLNSFDIDEVDMLSTIIIGNSTTRMIGEKIVTPRGYLKKYRK